MGRCRPLPAHPLPAATGQAGSAATLSRVCPVHTKHPQACLAETFDKGARSLQVSGVGVSGNAPDSAWNLGKRCGPKQQTGATANTASTPTALNTPSLRAWPGSAGHRGQVSGALTPAACTAPLPWAALAPGPSGSSWLPQLGPTSEGPCGGGRLVACAWSWEQGGCVDAGVVGMVGMGAPCSRGSATGLRVGVCPRGTVTPSRPSPLPGPHSVAGPGAHCWLPAPSGSSRISSVLAAEATMVPEPCLAPAASAASPAPVSSGKKLSRAS